MRHAYDCFMRIIFLSGSELEWDFLADATHEADYWWLRLSVAQLEPLASTLPPFSTTLLKTSRYKNDILPSR